jgi:hypothetical protein
MKYMSKFKLLVILILISFPIAIVAEESAGFSNMSHSNARTTRGRSTVRSGSSSPYAKVVIYYTKSKKRKGKYGTKKSKKRLSFQEMATQLKHKKSD